VLIVNYRKIHVVVVFTGVDGFKVDHVVRKMAFRIFIAFVARGSD
jgi:hypothetical protein